MPRAFTQAGRGPGGGTTKTPADVLTVPPVPVQDRLKSVVVDSVGVGSVPEVARAPDQPPEAVQDVAFVEDQVSADDPPLATDVGVAVSDTVADGGGVPDTLTDADALALPPEPVQVREKLPLALSEPVDWLPDIALDPDHAPEATQEIAPEEDQLSVEAPPVETDVGVAVSDTVGLTRPPPPPPLVMLVLTSEPQPAKTRASTETNSNVFMRNMGSSSYPSSRRFRIEPVFMQSS